MTLRQLFIFAFRTLAGVRSGRGQSLAEYALVLSFVSLLSVVLMSIFASRLPGIFAAIVNALNAARAAI